MTKQLSKTILVTAALMLLGACAQIVGIEDPKPIEGASSSGGMSSGSGSSGGMSSGSGSSGSMMNGPPGRWIAWPMPNGSVSGLPNQADYQIDATNDVVIDNVTGLMWQRTADSQMFQWADAVSHCENLVHAGHDDWRLPWRIELVSLIDFNRVDPSIDTAAFPGTPSAGFWSASDDNVGVWFSMFTDGNTYSTFPDTYLNARCVR
ncbi:MAG TPA: DUF1566 domain-containing protein [Polyangium sp.]|nr:DUF1566 domain-containing protein [Polyangium sp.]